MTKRMLIDATHHEETRVIVMDGQRLTEFDYESQFRRQLKGNIFLAKVTRVEPSLQAAFVNFGGNRHGFLPFSEIHPDYYRIPVADREELLAEQRRMEEEVARREAEEEAEEEARLARGDAGMDGNGEDDGFVAPAEAIEGDDQGDVAADSLSDSAEGDEDDQGDDSEDENGEEDADADRAGDFEVNTPQAHDAQELALDETGYVHEEIDLTLPEDTNDDSKPDGDDESAGREDEGRGDGRARGRGWRRGNGRGRGGNGHGNGGRRYMGARRHRSQDEMNEDGPAGLHARFRRRYKIQEVIKRGQIMLIQVSKEERGNKGAAVTTYLSLPGRYCVLMPNSPRGGGVSRKIGNFADRRRLKSMLKSLEIPSGMSVILRTAGVERSEAEIKRDHDYLLRLWDNIREMTLASNAPALIYEEGDLIKRSIRDIYSRDIDELLIAGEKGYEEARDFMSVLMPGHEENIKLYEDKKIPLFHRYQVESQITEIGEPIVQLKSGGYLVINQTEALVAIDVNSGRATKERHIEETALKTNLEAADEVARQLRLRDLGGLVVIDFIDMEDRRNNAKVERRLKDALASDRARIQVSRISTFGLLELSRQRLNPSLTEAQFQKCPHCHGFGFIRSVDSAAILALRALEDEGVRGRAKRVTLHIPNDIALYILNEKRKMLAAIEERYGFTVLIHVDPSLAPSGYLVEPMKAEVVDADDADGDDGAEPARARKKPVAMEHALEDDASGEEMSDVDQGDSAFPGQDHLDEGDVSDENFNRPDVEPDGDHEQRRRDRGPRRAPRRGNNRDRDNAGGGASSGSDAPGRNRDDRPRRGKYGPRRGPGNKNNRSRDDRPARMAEGDSFERGDRGGSREQNNRPSVEIGAPSVPASPAPKAEPTFFVAKRRSASEGGASVPAPDHAASAPLADMGGGDPSAPKKKGWWSKFS